MTAGKRPIFMIPTEGKSKEQIKAEARQALARYREASPPPVDQHDDGDDRRPEADSGG